MSHIQLSSSYTDRTLSHRHPSPSLARHRKQRAAVQVWGAGLGIHSSGAAHFPTPGKVLVHSVDAQKQTTSALCEDSCQSHWGTAMASLLTVASDSHLCTPADILSTALPWERMPTGFWTVVHSPARLYFPSTHPELSLTATRDHRQDSLCLLGALTSS